MKPGLQAVRVGELRLQVATAGSGTPVLLLHGFPDTHEVWRHQLPALAAAGYRVIAPDLRGYGDSDAPLQVADYALGHLLGDVIGLLDALDIHEPVHLVGHDWGAVLGWQLAIHHPLRFASYAALSVGHPYEYRSDSQQLLRAWYLLLFSSGRFAEWLLRQRDWQLFRALVGRHPETPAWIASLSRPGRLRAALNWYRANVIGARAPAADTTPLPVLGLWSDGDRALTETQMRQSQRRVGGAWRYERIEGASHWLQLDQPETLNRLLLEWFAQPRG